MNDYIKICPECNTPVPLSSRFCPQCGACFSLHQADPSPLGSAPSPSDPASDPVRISPKTFRGFLLSDLEICIGSQYSVYMDKFSKRRQGKHTFNWCSAIFSTEWLLYRKMWKAWLYVYLLQSLWGLLYNVFLSVLSFFMGFPLGFLSLAESHLGLAVLFILVYWLIPSVILGFLGDGIYWRHIRSLLIRHQCFRRPPVYEESLVQTLQEEGQTLTVWEFIMLSLLCRLPSWASSALMIAGRNMVLKLLGAIFR